MRRFLLLFLLLGASSVLHAQEVLVQATIDSIAIYIGQQVGMTISVAAPDSATVVLPVLKEREYITPGVEIVTVLADDTVRAKGRKTIARKVLLTSFDEDAYKIPSQTVRVGKKEYQTNPLALKVYTVDVDTTALDHFFPPKDVQDNPFLWDEWKGLYRLSIVVFLLIIIALYLFIRYKQNKPIISRIVIVKHIPPHQKALSAIAQIKQEQPVAVADQKIYYTRLTDALRQYIEERFSFSAMEMTTSEIIAHLQESGDAGMIDELRSLFEMADLVKFAKHAPLLNENDRNLVAAINFIDQTKTQEQEHEERIVPQLSAADRRVQESRKITKVLLASIGVALVVLLVLIIYNVMLLV